MLHLPETMFLSTEVWAHGCLSRACPLFAAFGAFPPFEIQSHVLTHSAQCSLRIGLASNLLWNSLLVCMLMPWGTTNYEKMTRAKPTVKTMFETNDKLFSSYKLNRQKALTMLKGRTLSTLSFLRSTNSFWAVDCPLNLKGTAGLSVPLTCCL